MTTSLRAFAVGYELFQPHRVIGWHAYDRSSASATRSPEKEGTAGGEDEQPQLHEVAWSPLRPLPGPPASTAMPARSQIDGFPVAKPNRAG